MNTSDRPSVPPERVDARPVDGSSRERPDGPSGPEVDLGPEDYRAMYDFSPEGALFTTTDGRVLAANPAAGEILGRREEEIRRLGRHGLLDHDDERWAQLLEERARTGRVRGVARMVRGDGAKIEVELSSQVFVDASGQERACTIINDVTERVRIERELIEMSERLRTLTLTDELTGLHNRRGFVTVARQVLEIAARQGAKATILFVDIDNMKLINDRFGHDSGDAAIRAVADALREELRGADTVARLGGDEFAALVLDLADTELGAVEQRLRRRLARPRAAAAAVVEVSVGWSVHPVDESRTIEQLLAAADGAMYHGKASKRRR